MQIMIRKPWTLVPAIVAALIACHASAQVPTTQTAVVQTRNGGPEVLELQTVPVLEPGPGQVLIRVHAAAVNPVDWRMREGYRGRQPAPGDAAPPGSPAAQEGQAAPAGQEPRRRPPPVEPPVRIPGFDAAGTIAAIGPDVTGVSVGDAVFTMIGMIRVDGLNGGYSEYVVAPADRSLPMPDGFTFAEAAGLGTVGLAAARVLVPVDIQPGQRVFVNGIAGGVGSSAAQIAKARGAIVIGTASARHHEYLESIGVDQIVDYTQVDFEDVVEPVDVYVETVGPEFATRGLQIIKPGGAIASVVGVPAAELCTQAEVDCPELGPPDAQPEGGAMSEPALLERVRQLADEGSFRINVDRAFPLAEAGAAQEYNREGHTTGKVILIVREEI